MQAFAKIVRPGTAPVTPDINRSLFVNIKWDGEGLSFTGVHGPKRDGDCSGSCGQCVDTLKDVDNYAPGWDAHSVELLRLNWERWHLNNMRAGCEHQHGNIDTTTRVSVYTYRLHSAVLVRKGNTRRAAEKVLASGGSYAYTPEELELVNLPWRVTTDGDADNAPCPESYVIEKQENPLACHTSYDKHPKGLLSKPCEVCGYKYGTKWLKGEVPADVLKALSELPETDRTPAWV